MHWDSWRQICEVVEAADNGGVEHLPLGLGEVELEEEGEHAVGGQLLEADAEELPGHAPGVTGDDSEGALVSASPVIFVTLTLTHL